MQTFAHYCGGLIRCLWDSYIKGRIVASGLVGLLCAEVKEHLSDEVGSIRFGGKGEAKVFEGSDGQKHDPQATPVINQTERTHELTNLPH
jgi:hypothetical protein